MTPSENIHERIRSFFKANHDMACAILTTPEPADAAENEAMKIEWFTYLAVRGHTRALDTWRMILNGGGKGITVPCARPDLFDPSYVAPAQKWRDPNRVVKQGERGDMSRVIETTLDSLRNALPKGQKRQTKPKVEQIPPAQWLEEYKANPPPIPVFSDEFKRQMRLGGAPDQSAA